MLLLPLFHWFGAPIGSMTVHEKDKVRSGWQKKTPAVALAPNRLPRTITACKLSLRRGQQRYASERPLGGTVVCAQVDGRDVVEPRPPGRLLRGARVVDVCVGGFVVWGGRIWIKVRPNVLSKFFSPHNNPPPTIKVYVW